MSTKKPKKIGKIQIKKPSEDWVEIELTEEGLEQAALDVKLRREFEQLRDEYRRSLETYRTMSTKASSQVWEKEMYRHYYSLMGVIIEDIKNILEGKR